MYVASYSSVLKMLGKQCGENSSGFSDNLAMATHAKL